MSCEGCGEQKYKNKILPVCLHCAFNLISIHTQYTSVHVMAGIILAELYSLFTIFFLLYSYILYTGHIGTYWFHCKMHLLTAKDCI